MKKIPTLAIGLLLLALAACILVLGLRLRSVCGQRDQLLARLDSLRDAEQRIATLEKTKATLELAALGSARGDFQTILGHLQDALRKRREAVGRDLKEQFVAEHYAELAMDRLRAFGPERFDAIDALLMQTDQQGRHIHHDMRKRLLDILFEYDAQRATIRSRQLLEQRGEDPSLRVYAAHALKRHAPKIALDAILGVLDAQRSRPGATLPNLAELVKVLGEVGQEVGADQITPALRDLAVHPAWPMDARHEAISWIATLGITAAFDDLEQVVFAPGHNHMTRLKALQTMRKLDARRTKPVCERLASQRGLDAPLKTVAARMLLEINEELGG